PYRYSRNWNITHDALHEDCEQKMISADYPGKEQLYNASMRHIAQGTLHAACNCGRLTSTEFCIHLVHLVNSIIKEFGAFYFSAFDDHSREIEEELNKYGFTTNDEIAKHFKFGFDQRGTFTLIEKPGHIIPVSSPEGLESMADSLGLKKNIFPL